MEFVIIVSQFEGVFYAHFEHSPKLVFRSKQSAWDAVAHAFEHFEDEMPGNASFTVHIVQLQKKVDDAIYVPVGEVRASQ